MRECLGKHSCMSSTFLLAILNGTCFYPTVQLQVHEENSVPDRRNTNAPANMYLYYARSAQVVLPMRVGGATSQLDLPSLTSLSLAGCGRLQLRVPGWATSVDYCKQLIIDPTFCGSRFSTGRFLAIEDFYFTKLNMGSHSCLSSSFHMTIRNGTFYLRSAKTAIRPVSRVLLN